MSVLQVTNLSVSYPGRPPVVDGVSLSIAAGEFVGVAGASGCGKTTLALALMGLLPADVTISGSVRFGGRELREMASRISRPFAAPRSGSCYRNLRLP